MTISLYQQGELIELLESANSELQHWTAQDLAEPAVVTAALAYINVALVIARSGFPGQEWDKLPEVPKITAD